MKREWIGRCAVIISAALWASWGMGCATSGRVDKVEGDVATLRQELDATRNRLDNELADTLRQAQADLENIQKVSKEASDRLARNSADLGAEMIEVKKAIDQIRGDVEGTRRNLAQLEKDFDLFRKDVDSRLTSAPAKDNLPEDATALWDEGNRRFDGGDWPGALSAFQRYVERFPSDKKADNAQLLLGQSYLNQGKYAEAVLELGKVVQKFKASDVEDAAIFRIGEAFIGLGKCDDAKAMFEGFVAEYPRSKFKNDARGKVKQLQSKKICY